MATSSKKVYQHVLKERKIMNSKWFRWISNWMELKYGFRQRAQESATLGVERGVGADGIRL